MDEAILRRELPDDLARGLADFAQRCGLDPTALHETAAMLALAGDAESFDGFSLACASPETSLCLLPDASSGAVGAKYNAARCGEDMIARLLDSLLVMLQAVTWGEDDVNQIDMLSAAQLAELDAFNETDIPYEANETLIDRIDRAAAYASFGFDACMMDMYPTLCGGAQLHIIAEEIRLDLIAIRRYFAENQITHAFMTTQVGRQYAELFPDSEYPRFLSVGGETLVPVEPPRFLLTNGYGPTECTIFTTTFPVDRLYRNVPIGKALDNLKLYVLDSRGHRVPVGVPGELCVAGPQVGRGYLNRPEQSAQAFVRNPFSGDARAARMYRTGDVVRFLPDGNVEFIGRRDSQVKIRGFRIELSEVEGVIRQFDGIRDATVVAYDETGGGKYVAAYVVSDEPVDVEALNRFIRERKPPYMVPAVTMQIERIPLNQNQKVNRRALPVPERRAESYAPPETDVQRKIYESLSRVIGHSSFGADTDFFEAGLTSVGSIKFLVLLTNAFGAAVTTRALRECNTAQKLEGYLRTAERAVTSDKRDRYPLTQTQMGIYVECMKHPKATFYNLPGSFPLRKDTDVNRLCDAIRRAVDAHPAVKCSVRPDEAGRVCMFPRDDRPVEIEIIRGTEADYESFFNGFARPFDFEHGPLYRFALFLTEAHVYLLLDFHHIICDGSSIAVFAQELDRALRGEAPLGEPYSQFDLAVDEEKARASEAYQSAKRYYDGVFSGVSGCTVPERDAYEERERCGFVRKASDRLPRARGSVRKAQDDISDDLTGSPPGAWRRSAAIIESRPTCSSCR